MAYDLLASIEEGKKDLTNDKLGVVILGSSGAGKSRICGTFGVKTLYLYTSGEAHGVMSAASGGSEILPVCIDKDKGATLSPDAAYERLLAILNDVDGIKKLGVKAIAIDGLTELENITNATSAFESGLATAYKGVRAYSGPLTLALMRPVIDALRSLQRQLGIHYAVTCILNVKAVGTNGLIEEAEPSLKGYQVAVGMIQQFPDIIVLGQMSNGEKVAPRIQLQAGVTKVTKDFKTQEVRKLMNFVPRLTGVTLDDAPDTLTPDLSRIVAIKKAGKYVKKGEAA